MCSSGRTQKPGVTRATAILEPHSGQRAVATTVPEFITYAKSNPGSIKMGKVGTGQSPHMSAELFKMMTGINWVYVPFPSTPPMLTALLSGQVQFTFDSMPSSIAYIKAGKLRPLAVTTVKRSEALPNVPTIADYVPAYEASGWFGIGAPKSTPGDVIDRLNEAVDAAFADPKMKTRFADLGGMLLRGSPTDFSKLIAEETEKWAKVVKFSGAKPD